MSDDSDDENGSHRRSNKRVQQKQHQHNTAARRMLQATSNNNNISSSRTAKLRFIITEGMSCGGCASRIETALSAAPGIASASVVFATGAATVQLAQGEDAERMQSWVVDHVQKMGYKITALAREPAPPPPSSSSPPSSSPSNAGAAAESSTRESTTAAAEREQEENAITEKAILREAEITELTRATLIASFCAVPFFLVMLLMGSSAVLKRFWLGKLGVGVLRMRHLVGLLISTPAVFFAGRGFFQRALRAWKHSSLTMDTLVALGVGVSYGASILLCVYMGFFMSPKKTTSMARPVQLPNGGKKVMVKVPGTETMDVQLATYFDVSVMLLFFVCLGKLLEAKAKRATGDALVSLMHLMPSNATVTSSSSCCSPLSPSDDRTVPTSSLAVGDVVRVTPGASVPCDGEVIENGSSIVSEAMVTGESMPVEKGPGDAVIGGTVNVGEHELLVKATRCGRDTALAHILRTVRDAAASKPSMLRATDGLSSIFVPFVVVAAVAVFVFWAVAGAAGAYPEAWRAGESSLAFAFSFGLATLVCACPCALGLAAPTCVVVASGVASRLGILLKSAEVLEAGACCDTVVFDKTGTLTTSSFEVTSFSLQKQFYALGEESTGADVAADEFAQEVLACAAVVESKSNHPIAKEVSAYARSELTTGDAVAVKNFQQVPGKGVRAEVELPHRARGGGGGGGGGTGTKLYSVVIGTIAFLEEMQCTNVNAKVKSFVEEMTAGGAAAAAGDQAPSVVVCVAIDNRFVATFQLRDSIKPTAKATVAYLRHVQKMDVYLASGDTEHACHAVAAAVGIEPDKVFASMLPKQKVDLVQRLQAEENDSTASRSSSSFWTSSFVHDAILNRSSIDKKRRVVAFVGDGINDAAALATSHLGVAIGGGVDVAIDAGDVVLMRNDIFLLAVALDLCATSVERIVINLLWAVLYNLVTLPLAAGFLFPFIQRQLMKPQVAGAAMMLSSLSVLASSLLLKFYDPPGKRDGFAALNTSVSQQKQPKQRRGRAGAWSAIDDEDDDDDEDVVELVTTATRK